MTVESVGYYFNVESKRNYVFGSTRAEARDLLKENLK